MLVPFKRCSRRVKKSIIELLEIAEIPRSGFFLRVAVDKPRNPISPIRSWSFQNKHHFEFDFCVLACSWEWWNSLADTEVLTLQEVTLKHVRTVLSHTVLVTLQS